MRGDRAEDLVELDLSLNLAADLRAVPVGGGSHPSATEEPIFQLAKGESQPLQSLLHLLRAMPLGQAWAVKDWVLQVIDMDEGEMSRA